MGKRRGGLIFLIYWTYPGQQLTEISVNWNSRKSTTKREAKISRDEVGLNRIMKQNRRASLHEITTTFNDNKQHSFSSRTIRRKLASEGYKRPAAKKCVIVHEVNRKKRVVWCRGKRNWTVDSHWRKYIYILMKVR